MQDWKGCCRAANRVADLVCAMYYPGNKLARQTYATATLAEIIASELGIEIPEGPVTESTIRPEPGR